MLTMFYTYEEATDLFGEPEDSFDESYYIEIPEDLYNRFLKSKEEFYAASRELARLAEEKEKGGY